MSRSALWRQEAGVKERQMLSQDVFAMAVEEGRNARTKGMIPLYGPDDSFHIHPLLLQSIVKSPYLVKCCRDINDWNALVDEIYYEVKHVEPWAAAGQQSNTPSSAFCLLLRLLTLRCSEKQMRLILDHRDSPFIRCIGFLYLRYACKPALLWSWIQPYLYDEEPVRVRFTPSSPEISIGEYVRNLFGELEYFGTRLPRLPILVERELNAKLLQAGQVEERAKRHFACARTMDYFQKLGSQVRAQYEDEHNPLTWYNAVIDRVITLDPDTSTPLRRPKFVVTFPEYGNTEIVTLGDLDLPHHLQTEMNRTGCRQKDAQGQDFHTRGGSNAAYGREKDSFNTIGGSRQVNRYSGGVAGVQRGYMDGRGYSCSEDRSREMGRHEMKEVHQRDTKDYNQHINSSCSNGLGKRTQDAGKNSSGSGQCLDSNAPSGVSEKPREATRLTDTAIAEKRRKLAHRYG